MSRSRVRVPWKAQKKTSTAFAVLVLLFRRSRAESNRCRRFCRPVPSPSATGPIGFAKVRYFSERAKGNSLRHFSFPVPPRITLEIQVIAQSFCPKPWQQLRSRPDTGNFATYPVYNRALLTWSLPQSTSNAAIYCSERQLRIGDKHPEGKARVYS